MWPRHGVLIGEAFGLGVAPGKDQRPQLFKVRQGIGVGRLVRAAGP
jgi:hypothetical protein